MWTRLQVAEVAWPVLPPSKLCPKAKAQQPTNQPATWKHLAGKPTSNCQPINDIHTQTDLSTSGTPLHRATSFIARDINYSPLQPLLQLRAKPFKMGDLW
jgi:hypothetical protein